MIKSKCRLLYVALLALGMILPSHAWSLGLGEIEVESALNERFNGAIELLDAQGFQSAEIVVGLATREDFDRIGVERFFYLTQLKFAVDLEGSVPSISVSSDQPISEPYLNFIVEVLWPNGRLLKEFTVLLDPPTFSQAAAPTVSAPAQVTQAPAPRPAAPARPATRVTLQPSPAAPSQPSQPRRPVGAGDGVYTTRDDTLWTIASRTLPSARVSVNQQMLAIQRLNRGAFIRDNINLLKAGYELDMPSEQEALSMTAEEANYAVANQTNAWKEGTEVTDVASAPAPQGTPLVDDAGTELASQLDASSDAAPAAAAGTDGQGQVRIVANTGELASGTASGGEQVNQLIEEKETLNRQVEELNYQLDREKEISTNQISVKERQLEVKDQEIAELQQQLKEVREQLQQSAQNQNQSTPPAEPAPWWQNPMVLFGVIGVLILALAGLMIALRRNRAEQGYQDYDTAEADYDTAEDTYVDSAQALAVSEPGLADDDDTQVEPTVGVVAEAQTEDREDSEEEYFELDDDEEAEAPGEQPAGQTQTSDVIGEAEIYIAYGRYGQAANLLLGVLNEDPERYDVRLKLLEVYVESQDDEPFEQHAQYILDNCSDEEVLLAVQDLEGQLGDSRVVLDDNDDTLVDAPAAAEEAAAPADEGEGDLTLELDSLEDAEPADGEAAADDEFELEFDLDDDAKADSSDDDNTLIDYDSAAAVESAAVESAAVESAADDSAPDSADDITEVAAAEESGEDDEHKGSALGGDLGIDFDPEQDVAVEEDTVTAAAVESAAEDGAEDGEIDLDTLFDDDDEDSSTAEPVAAAADEGDDFEFGAESDADINATKLDLAEAYVDMGDADGARDILNEVLDEGTQEQQHKAQEMLSQLNG